MILQAAAQAASEEPNFMMWVGGSAIIVAVAILAMRWTSKTVKKDLDPAMSGKMRQSMAMQAETVPPSLVREALQKGLVTSQQLATMSPIERSFLFKSLMPKLAGGAEAGHDPGPMLSANAPALPLKQSAPSAPANAAQLRSTQAMVAIPGKAMNLPPLSPEQLAALGPPPGMPPRPVAPAAAAVAAVAAAFGAESLEADLSRMHCPCCGTRLNMPTFAPYVAFCDQCGAKTAVRIEDQGRLIINTAPPGVTRKPIK